MKKIAVDKVVPKVVGYGAPIAYWFLCLGANNYEGSAKITNALKAYGPGGMKGGTATLLLSPIAFDAATSLLVNKAFSKSVQTMYDNGMSFDKIFKVIDNYPISEELKIKLKGLVLDEQVEA